MPEWPGHPFSYQHMERRDALKSLAALAGATGMSVTPVTTTDAEKVTLVILKVKGMMRAEHAERLESTWEYAVEGTELQGVKVVVFDEGVEAEFVRGTGRQLTGI